MEMHSTKVETKSDKVRAAVADIEVGMGASYRTWTDVNACTVIAVDKKRGIVTLQYDKATLLNGANSGEPDALEFFPGGFCGHTAGVQRWSFERDENGTVQKVSARVIKVSEWDSEGLGVVNVEKVIFKTCGQPTKTPGGDAKIGNRSHHYDFNF
jgi:hypothetical protein